MENIMTPLGEKRITMDVGKGNILMVKDISRRNTPVEILILVPGAL